MSSGRLSREDINTQFGIINNAIKLIQQNQTNQQNQLNESGGGTFKLVDDTSPKLGGNLQLNGHAIVGELHIQGHSTHQKITITGRESLVCNGAVTFGSYTAAEKDAFSGDKPRTGMCIFNSTSNDFEFYNGSIWVGLGGDAPVVTTLGYPPGATALNTAGGEILTINGNHFASGVTVQIGETAISTVEVINATQIRVTSPAKSVGSYDLKINVDGRTTTVVNAVVYSGTPTFVDNNSNYGDITSGDSVSINAGATGDSPITYTIATGALPPGLSLNSDTGNISGTAPSVSVNTTYSLTVQASDGQGQTNTRSFTITVSPILPSTQFNTILYSTGNNPIPATTTITGLAFQPDIIWIKQRVSENHNLYDTTRGTNLFLSPNKSEGSVSSSNRVTAFIANTGTNSDGGFTIGDNNEIAGDPAVAWCWKVGGGTTSTNTTGGITSTVQVNNNAGISIVKYTGTGSAATVGHGLDAAPELIIVKHISGGANNSNLSWYVYSSVKNMGRTKYMTLDTNAAPSSDPPPPWNNTSPTSSVFTVGGDVQTNKSSDDFIAYCFTSKPGLTKVGSYTGIVATNPTSTYDVNGQIVYTGFRPAFVMIKRTDGTGSWIMFDNKRSGNDGPSAPGAPSQDSKTLAANTTDAETTTAARIHFFDNGFQLLTSNDQVNGNNNEYMYLAHAADPDPSVPTKAGSFNIKTFTGTGSAQTISSFGFNPNFALIKPYNSGTDWNLLDTVRFNGYTMHTNNDQAEQEGHNHIANYTTGGFTMGNSGEVSQSGISHIAYAFKADDHPATIYQKSPRHLHGSIPIVNTAGIGTDSNGKFGKATTFDANLTYSSINISGHTNFATTGVSISAWVKISSFAASRTIVNLYYENGIVFGTNTSGNIQISGPGTTVASTTTITQDTWTHAVMAADDNGNIKFYLNNVDVTPNPANAGSIPGMYTNVGNADRIGSYATNDGKMAGSIDNIRIFRKQLTPTEVATLYNETESQNNTLQILGDTSCVSAYILNGVNQETSVNANQAAGFSIVAYDGAGVETSIPHGLGAAPEFIIVKSRNGGAGQNWAAFHKDVTNDGTNCLVIDNANAPFSADYWDSKAPNSDVFYLGDGAETGSTNTSTRRYIAYCWRSISGFSKIGSYTGNEPTANQISMDFKPDFLLIRRSSGAGNWCLFDSKRPNKILFLNDATQQQDFTYITFREVASGGGFAISASAGMGGDTNINENNHTYIYVAFKIN